MLRHVLHAAPALPAVSVWPPAGTRVAFRYKRGTRQHSKREVIIRFWMDTERFSVWDVDKANYQEYIRAHTYDVEYLGWEGVDATPRRAEEATSRPRSTAGSVRAGPARGLPGGAARPLQAETAGSETPRESGSSPERSASLRRRRVPAPYAARYER